MLFRSAWAAFEPDEIGTRSSTVSGVVVMRDSSSTGRKTGSRTSDRTGSRTGRRTGRRTGSGGPRIVADRPAAPAPRRVGDLAPQHRGDVGLEQFKAGPVLSVGEPARVGVQVQDRVPELLVVAVHLLDHLSRAA